MNEAPNFGKVPVLWTGIMESDKHAETNFDHLWQEEEARTA
jgi:hypothetical protein